MGSSHGKQKREERNKKLSQCMNCHSASAKHLRAFDYKKLPEEYFHRPESSVASLLAYRGIDDSQLYPDYWVHLPKQYTFTKYPLKVCDACYAKIKNDELQPWNSWKTLN